MTEDTVARNLKYSLVTQRFADSDPVRSGSFREKKFRAQKEGGSGSGQNIKIQKPSKNQTVFSIFIGHSYNKDVVKDHT